MKKIIDRVARHMRPSSDVHVNCTRKRFGLLELFIVEMKGTPMQLFLSDVEGEIVETRPDELFAAADAVRALLTQPKRRRSP